MPAIKPSTPKGQKGIESFLSTKKRSPPERVTSPTNQTSSPDQKKAAVNDKSGNPEEMSNEPSPALMNPQRDKQITDDNPAMKEKDDVVMEDVTEEVHTDKLRLKQKEVGISVTEGQKESYLKEPKVSMENQQENTGEAPNSKIQETDKTKTERLANKKGQNQEKKVKEIPKEQINLKSALKNTFRDVASRAANLPEPAPIIPKWEAHRFACMFDIKMPKDRSKRTEYLAIELNKMIECLREYAKVYVRKYSDFHMPRNSDKTSWISKFDKKKVSDLNSYTSGFYYYQPLRDGTFRLLIQLILPVGTDIPELLINANGHKWAGKNNRSIRDIREQNLHSPKYIGWLFRSNYSMVGSNELQTAFEERAGIHFGLTFKSVPMNNQGKYDKDTAIKAICVSCNDEDQDTAWNTLMDWYNSKKPKFPLGIQMMFIPSKNHPDIRNNPAAAQNISTLLDRQRIFLRDTEVVSCPHLAFPDAKTSRGRTLRQELMDLTARTMGDDHLGSKLFHSINKKVDMKGNELFQFTFHKSVARESLSVISGMGQFLAKELKLDAEFYCHPHLLKDGHKWDVKKRCVINPTTSYISNLAFLAGPGDDIDGDEVNEEYSMDTKGRRESRRITGRDEEETVRDLTKKKKARDLRTIPKNVKDDSSTRSEISELTKFSSSTKASRERKNLRILLDEKDDKINRLLEELARQKLNNPTSTDNSSSSDNNSGESTAETPNETTAEIPIKSDTVQVPENGWNFDDDYEDKNEVEITKVAPPPQEKRPDGLYRLFRGPPKQVQDVADYYKKRGEKTIQTLPFKDGTITKVNLYKVVDPQSFREAQGQLAVKFEDTAMVQEYDNTTGVLTRGRRQTVKSNSDRSHPEEGDEDSVASDSDRSNSSGTDSRASSSSSDSGSNSDSSLTSESSPRDRSKRKSPRKEKKDKLETRKRPTSVTQAMITQARQIADETNTEESVGDGPTSDD